MTDKMTAKLVLLVLWILPFMPSAQLADVKIGVFVESSRDLVGTGIREKIDAAKAGLISKGEPNTVTITGSDTDWSLSTITDGSASADLTVAITALPCDEDLGRTDDLLRVHLPKTAHIAMLKDNCPRPPKDRGIGFPVLMPTTNVVPVLVDLRTNDLKSWDSVLVIYDDSLDINQLEGVAEVFMSSQYTDRTSTVVTFQSCPTPTCNAPNEIPMKSILEPIRSSDDDRHFLIIGKGGLLVQAIETAKSLDMLSLNRKYLYVSTEKTVDNPTWDAVKSTPKVTNMAVIHRESESESCQPAEGCLVDAATNTLMEAISKVTSSDPVTMKNEIIKNMQEILMNSKECGSCMKWVIKSTYLEDPYNWRKVYRTGTWSPYVGLKIDDGSYLFPVSSGDFHGKNIKIGIMEVKPEVSRNKKSGDLEGLTVQLVKELSYKMNFTYEWVIVADKEYGNKINGKEWGGLMRMLLNNEVEFVANGLYITKDRAEAVNFTTALDEEPYLVFIRMPQMDYTYLFLAPFTWDTWICITITVFLMGPLLNIVHKLSKYYDYYDMNDGKGLYLLSNCAWYCFGAVVQQGGIHLPWSISGRVLVGFWWIFVIVTVTSYSGNLVAVLTFPKIRNPIDTIDGLISYRRSIKWGAFNGEAIVEYLENARSGPLMMLGRSLQKYNREDFDKILVRVRRNKQVMFMSEREIMTKIEEKLHEENTCNYYFSKEPVYRETMALPVPKGWPYLERMNKEIKKLVESGLVTKWKREYWPKENVCTTTSKPQAGDTRKISLEHMWGSFFVLFFGFGSAVVSLTFEVVYRKLYLSPENSRMSAQVRDGTMRKDGMAFQGTGTNISSMYPTQSKVNLLYDADAEIPEQFTYNLPRDIDKYPGGGMDSGRNKKRRF